MLVAVPRPRCPRRLLGVGAARIPVDRLKAAGSDHRHQSPSGTRVEVWEQVIEDDEICFIDGMRVTTPARTALDLACRYPLDEAVAAIDALARATRLKLADVGILLHRYRRRRDIKRPRAGVLIGEFDMGWEKVKVAVEYEGDQHWKNRWQFGKDIRRLEALTEAGWIDVRVTAEDTPATIERRVAAARAGRL